MLPCKHKNPEEQAKLGSRHKDLLPNGQKQCPACWLYINTPGYKELYERPSSNLIIEKPVTLDKKPCSGCSKTNKEKAFSALKSFASWTGQAFRKPNAEQLKTRETICQSNVCGKWKSATDQCSECGCFLKKILPIVGDVGKRNHADEACPLKLWKEIPPG